MWLPLESNPEVMNRYLTLIGLPEPKVEFVDVYGTSDDLLAMVPTPVYAVMLVYPICAATEKRAGEVQLAQRDEVTAFRAQHPFFFTRQYVPNACGTIAITHAIMNNTQQLGDIAPGSLLGNMLGSSVDKADPVAMGKALATNEELGEVHATAAKDGVTENQDPEANINLHFVCMISVGGRCVELDGRKHNPTLHGACTDDASFLKAAAAAIQEKMDLNPDSYEFGITALVGKQSS